MANILLDLGYFKGSDPKTTRLELRGLDPGEQGPFTASSTRRSAQTDLRDVRAQCRNQLHVATLVLQDEDLGRKANILFEMSEGMVDWLHRAVAECKSPAENRALYTRQAGGGVWKCLQGSLDKCLDPADLAKLGFLLEPLLVWHSTWTTPLSRKSTHGHRC